MDLRVYNVDQFNVYDNMFIANYDKYEWVMLRRC